jgi:hypothetical protein
MKMKTAGLLMTAVLLQLAAVAQENWNLRKDKNGIRISSRKTANFKMDELKVECVFDGRISQLAAVLFDVNKQYTWVYKTSKSQLLKTVTPADVFFYSEIECPWPFDNRDMVVHMTLAQQPSSKALIIEAKSVNNYMPEKKGIVRLKYSNAIWTITPINGKQFRIDYRIQIDLGDGVPAWLVNLFSVNGPFESFSNLKKQIKLPQYAGARFPMVVD